MSSHDVHLGHIKRHPDGYAFFIPKNAEALDVFISPEDLKGAMSNDLVEIKILGSATSKRLRGRVEKIVERHFDRVVGRLDPQGSHYILKDKSYAWGEDLFIPVADINGAKKGELVLAEITSYPDERKGFVGKVISVIGKPSDPAVDVKRVIAESGAPMEFSEKALKEVEKYGTTVSADEIARRKDIRKLPLVTIDGVTAKDFDDAVFVEKKGKGYRLVVAIADVSYYVRPGMAVNAEAYERGTSIYMPNYVVPMLPEGLSNELCSLKPDVDRLCVVADMMISSSGEFESYEFYEAVMKSHGRLTYGQVQQVLDGTYVESVERHRDLLFTAQELALILMNKRFADGSLDLDIPEVLVEVDEQGNAVDIQLSERIFAHRLIEEFMLKANISIAKFIDSKKRPQIYRVHEDPDMLSLDLFMRFYDQIIGDSGSGYMDPREICNALSTLEGKEKNILQSLFLRSMKQARYSVDQLGHFGLGFSHYAHFTSPIRRYPDLMTHRILKSIIVGAPYEGYPEDEVDEMALFLSQCEQRAVKAERKVKSIKKARFAESLLSEEFMGSVTSVVRFGLFVTLDQYPLEGLVRIADLGSEMFIFDEDNLLLVGKHSGKQFKLGDRVKVRIAQVDIEDGFIDLELLEHLGKKQDLEQVSPWSAKNRFLQKRQKREERKQAKQNPSSKSSKNRDKNYSDKNYSDKNKSGHDKPKGSSGGKIKASDLFSSSHRSRVLGFGKNSNKNGKK
ncbi:MAG: ribonuclease R [Bdellovibrionaceae bacterium]|nr:ribonuclease R [Pseudobdellovibrionaceae bacterium]